MSSRETRGEVSPQDQPNRRFIEFRGKQYEVLDKRYISADAISIGDRAFIGTESGNRYMIRRSRSHSDALMIYSERTAFGDGYVLLASTDLAEIGKPAIFHVKDPSTGEDRTFSTTTVTAIEIRKGFDTAVESSDTDGLASMLKRHSYGEKS
jgi:hypothetical protein